MGRGAASESGHVVVADGDDDPIGRIVSELIEQLGSENRPLRFYEVEEKLVDLAGKLRFHAEKLEKEKALLRERLHVVCNEKSALEFNVGKMRDCVELSRVFLRLGGSGQVNASDMTGEEIYEAMLRKLMSGNEEDLTEVVVHLRRKVGDLERDSKDSETLKRKVNELEMENVEAKRVVGDMRQRIAVLEVDNKMLTEKVGGSLRDAEELKRVKDELNMANAMLKVKAEMSSPNMELKLQYETLKRELDESRRICEGLERRNEVVRSNFDELVQDNEKLQKKLSFRKKNFEELQKRVIVLEKDVDEMKSCGDSVPGPKDMRGRHCSDERFASTTKNGKHSIELTGMLSDNGGCSVAGDNMPISVRVVDLMDSDDDAAVTVPLVKKRPSPDSLGKEPLPTSRVELKRKSDAFIDLTQNEDIIDEGDGLCRSSFRARNDKRSDLRGKMDGSPGSTRSSSTLLH